MTSGDTTGLPEPVSDGAYIYELTSLYVMIKDMQIRKVGIEVSNDDVWRVLKEIDFSKNCKEKITGARVGLLSCVTIGPAVHIEDIKKIDGQGVVVQEAAPCHCQCTAITTGT